MISNENLKEIVRLGAELNTVQDLDILLEKILSEARRCFSADAGSIYVREGDYLVFSHVQNDTLRRKLPDGQKLAYTRFKVPINKLSISGFVTTTGAILNIPDVYSIPPDATYHFDSHYDIISHYRTHSMLTVPMLTNRGEVIGVLQLINALNQAGEPVAFDSEGEPFAVYLANTASMILERARMTRAILLRMISMAELRDPKETGAHVNRVASYSVEIYERWAARQAIAAEEMEKNRDILRMAAMLHDVGKVAISDLILKKPARFTEEEYETMKSHTWLGAKLFADPQSEFDEVAAAVALTHHENWDGSGYPGLIDAQTGVALETDSKGRPAPRKGLDIPLNGRIVALADVYDALSCRRVYKEAWNEEDVLKEIADLSGTKFDPDLVDVFFESLDSMRNIMAMYPDTH